MSDSRLNGIVERLEKIHLDCFNTSCLCRHCSECGSRRGAEVDRRIAAVEKVWGVADEYKQRAEATEAKLRERDETIHAQDLHRREMEADLAAAREKK